MRINTNNIDPIYPPSIVCNCVDVSQVLYICMPENSITVNTDDSTNDTPLVTAVKINCLINKYHIIIVKLYLLYLMPALIV